MDNKRIKELIEIVEKSTISSFELEEAGYRIKIGKAPLGTSYREDSYDNESINIHGNDSAVFQTKNGVHRKGSLKSAVKPTTESEINADDETDSVPGEDVLSPMLGVFYSAPSPESEPFVKIGDKVKKGDVLCIIEAMKLMNEILAEKDGEITLIGAKNGQIVEFEQVIFKIL